jgi:hypothetical protein
MQRKAKHKSVSGTCGSETPHARERAEKHRSSENSSMREYRNCRIVDKS